MSKSRKRTLRRSMILASAKPATDHHKPLTIEAVAEVVFQATADGDQPKRPSFAIEAYNGGLLRVGGYYRPMVVDLKGLRAGLVTALRDHDLSLIVGQGTATIEKKRVTVAGQITGDWQDKNDPSYPIVLHARNGFKWAASVGVLPDSIEYVEAGQNATVNGQSFNGPIGIVRAGRLGEVSFVGVGADETASATVAATAAHTGDQNMDEFKKWLQAMGLSLDALSEDQRTRLQAKFDAEQAAPKAGDGGEKKNPAVQAQAGTQPANATEGGSDPLQAQRQERARELRRVAAIDQLQAKYSAVKEVTLCDGTKQAAADFLASAIETGTEADAVELVLLRASRQPVGSGTVIVGSGRDDQVTAQVCEAALCLQAGVMNGDGLVKAYGQQTANQAYDIRRVRFSRLAEQIAAAGGVRLDDRMGDTEWIRAAFSSAVLTGILGNVANKAMAAVLAEPDWIAPRITGTASHANFHAHTIYSLVTTGELQEVAPTGELKHLKLSEENYTRQVKTRGAVLKLTRQDIINDELGVFVNNARLMVRKAMITREKATFTLINATGAGSSFFTTARGNYFSGATSAFGNDSLSAAVKLFRDQKDGGGDPIMVEPRILLVPTALEDTARRLVATGGTLIVTGLSSTSAKGLDANANVHAGRFRVEVGPYLSNPNLTGYSETAWYLLADPNVLPVAEIAYLRGQQSPTIDFFGIESDPNELAATWRIFWDFGVSLAEYRAGVKSKGCA